MRTSRWLLVLLLTGTISSACSGNTDPGAAPTRSTATISSSGSAGEPLEIAAYHNARGESASFQANPDQVWKALVAAYADVGIEVGTLDEAHRVIGNRKLAVRGRLAGQPISRFLSCGTDAFGGALADKNRVELSVVSAVRSATGDASTLETQVQAMALRSASGSNMVCTSTGVLEQRLARAVGEQVGG